MPAMPAIDSSNLILGGMGRIPWSAARAVHARNILNIEKLFKDTKTVLPSQGQDRVVFLEVSMISEQLLSILGSYAGDFAAKHRLEVTINTRAPGGNKTQIRLGQPNSGRVGVIVQTISEVRERGAECIFGHHMRCGNAYNLPPEEAARSGLQSARYSSLAFVDANGTRIYFVNNN